MSPAPDDIPEILRDNASNLEEIIDVLMENKSEDAQTAEAARASLIGRVQDACHGFGPPEGGILDVDPSNPRRDEQIKALAERVAALEEKNKELEKLLKRHYHAHNGQVFQS